MEGTGLASLQSGVGLGAGAFLVCGLNDAHQSAVAQLNGRAVRCRIFAATKKGTPTEVRIPYNLADSGGLEPPTPGSVGRCSIQLSYESPGRPT